jgi:hypothetical protein
MFNYFFYKLFNPDLKNYNNNKLLIHWNTIGKNEKRISCYEDFFEKYPYFDNIEYKLFNKDLNFKDITDAMLHWHLYGSKDNRIYSNKHFYNLYPEYQCSIEENEYILKNEYHFNRNLWIKINNEYIEKKNNKLEKSIEFIKKIKNNISIQNNIFIIILFF